MVRNRFFSIAVLLVVGLFLAVLVLPGGAFAQDGSAGGSSNGQSGAAAIGNMIMQGWNHDQMHANAGQHNAGHMGQSMMGTGHMGNHANMGNMTTGSMATMHYPPNLKPGGQRLARLLLWLTPPAPLERDSDLLR